jgi:phage repressor protein C with HTH and peptisase S24 domain
MLPSLRPSQLVLAVRFLHTHTGDVVVVKHDNLEKIKRIGRYDSGQIFLVGDNPEHSTDSRSFGWLPETAIVAKVVWPRSLRARSR